MNTFSIRNLKPNASVHMIGIGGISMSALAHILRYFGYRVTGSDANVSDLTKKLEKNGIPVAIGQSADNIKSPDLVCYTAAIAEDDPELVKARSLGIPVLERAELLGQIMTLYQFPIAVAGTHGKTTTTSMLALVLLEAAVDPTILVGGVLPQIDGNLRIGSKEYLVCEACEYVESFLHFHPYLSIITNVEADHMDYFRDLSHIISSFEKFSSLNNPAGHIIVNSDDANAMKTVKNAQCQITYYGINDKNADFFAKNVQLDENGHPKFDIYFRKEIYLSVHLQVTGEHNIYNSLAVCAAAVSLGVEKEAIKRGLETFGGTKRRFEKIGECNGTTIIDDYAHHPTEIRATLNTAQEMPFQKVWCVFQPHTYSRTQAFLDDFAQALRLADRLIVADIYPAREKYDGSIHACDLAAQISGAVYMNDFCAIERYIRQNVQPGDAVITMGAGNVCQIAYALAGRI